MKYLLDSGVDINYVEQPSADPIYDSVFRGTASHSADETNDAERVQLLVECGANLDIGGPQGLTPLEAAEQCGRHFMAELFRTYGKQSKID
jgi:ankyrin repeat protein